MSAIKKPRAAAVNASRHFKLNRSLELHLIASVDVTGGGLEKEFRTGGEVYIFYIEHLTLTNSIDRNLNNIKQNLTYLYYHHIALIKADRRLAIKYHRNKEL